MEGGSRGICPMEQRARGVRGVLSHPCRGAMRAGGHARIARCGCVFVSGPDIMQAAFPPMVGWGVLLATHGGRSVVT